MYLETEKMKQCSRLRAWLYHGYLSVWTFCVTFPLAFFLWSYPICIWTAWFWGKGVFGGIKVICGIDYEIRGRERVPDNTPIILAPKHQSSWETFCFYQFFSETVYVLKKSIVRIPFFGWFHIGARNIPIDRDGGASTLKRLVALSKERLAQGRPIVIFPEGTRVPAGEKGEYQAGVYAVYAQTGATVIPVALNSGLFWPKDINIKRPGTVVMEYLEPIPPGLKRKEFMALLEERVESATERLLEEGQSQLISAGQS